MDERMAAGARTSLPEWPARVAVDPEGTSYALVGIGDPAEGIVRGWVGEVLMRTAPSPVWTAQADRADEVVDALDEQLGRARVGWRLMLAGPEADVLALRARALAAGAVDEEVRCHVTSRERLRVHCAHCTAETPVTAPPGSRTTCSGCGHPLHIYSHLSRHRGSYLGFHADVEAFR
ncbi:dimethylamine monooxygenase subunit DmmA family protein [Saccharopolyspora sp. ID03-671]|uniref:dimethylamine monooxygenase subunit DmmA family protein n=1 Tax=Saccharopolyspora sp. ID03-671 TaxID=3073066 RepID=UPI00324AADA4